MRQNHNGGSVPPLFFDAGVSGVPPAYDCQMATLECGMVDGQYQAGYNVAGGYGEVSDASFSLYMQHGWIAAGFDEMGARQIPGGGMLPEHVLAEAGFLQPNGLNCENLVPAEITTPASSSGVSFAVEATSDIFPAAKLVADTVLEDVLEVVSVEAECSSSRRGRRGNRGDKSARSEEATHEATKPEALSPEGSPRAWGGDVEAGGGVAAQGTCTTVMLRNIPNKYTREMLVDQLNRKLRGRFDFIYLPIDFKNKCNVGYGFINFRTVEACEEFVRQFQGVDVRKCLPGLKSNKVVVVTPARVQGLSENVRRLRNSPVMNQLVDHPEWMPMIFSDHGQEVFPKPDQPLPPVKPRGRGGPLPLRSR